MEALFDVGKNELPEQFWGLFYLLVLSFDFIVQFVGRVLQQTIGMGTNSLYSHFPMGF